MHFEIPTRIAQFESFHAFMDAYGINEKDLMLTSRRTLRDNLGEQTLNCSVIYREDYGLGEPNDEMIDKILDAAKGKAYERVFAIGGGTILDIGKLLVYGSSYRCTELFARGKELEKKRRLIAVPTTCGTGSEVTNISIAELKSLHTKLGLVASQLYPDEAVLIPQLLHSMPYHVFAASSLDALIHAMEAYVSINANPYTDAFAEAAMRKILCAYRELAEAKGDREVLARNMQSFLLASNMAGIAFGNAGCGAVHALSYPIGASFHVPHGKANYLLLTECFRMYKKKHADLTRLEKLLQQTLQVEASEVWQKFEDLLQKILPRESLQCVGMTQTELNDFPKTVLKTQTRLLGNMPVRFEEDDIREIYTRCM